MEPDLETDPIARLLEYELRKANVHDGPSCAWPLSCLPVISPCLLLSPRPTKSVCPPSGGISHAIIVAAKEYKFSFSYLPLPYFAG